LGINMIVPFRARLGVLFVLVLSLISHMSAAQNRKAFTVAHRDDHSVTSYQFFCDEHGNQLDCALARTAIRPKLTPDQVAAYTNPSADSLQGSIDLYTNGGTLCTENLDDQAIAARVLGGWGVTADPADVHDFVTAWRRVCAEPTPANGRALLKARATIDMKSCNVFVTADKRTFTFNGSRWVSVDTDAGILCPGSVVVETLEQKGLFWVYEVTENTNPNGADICAKAAQENGTRVFDFGSWGAPAPFTCHTIEFAPSF
jgi:hypothetical protein